MNRRTLLSSVGLGLLGAAIPSLGAADAPRKQPNVLFIAVDDLRPQLGCYGHKETLVFAKWGGCDAIKTDRYLYTEWRKGEVVTHRMLFDHKADPLENVNIADTPEASDIVDKLNKLIRPD